MDQILVHFEMEPLIKVRLASSRGRREFRGDRSDVQIQPELTFSWMKSFEKFTAKIPLQCEDLYNNYEEHVAEYGYSLRDPMKILPSPILQPYLLPSSQSSE